WLLWDHALVLIGLLSALHPNRRHHDHDCPILRMSHLACKSEKVLCLAVVLVHSHWPTPPLGLPGWPENDGGSERFRRVTQHQIQEAPAGERPAGRLQKLVGAGRRSFDDKLTTRHIDL